MNSKYMDQEFMDELIGLINIPSVYSEEVLPGAPFGAAVRDALHKVLNYGEKLGFSVKNYDGYAGELSMGTGDYIVGVLCHVDVVEAGKGWNTDPFHAQMIDGKLYGRGSSDDKGPLMVSLMAVKRLYDEKKIPDDVTVRIIIGTNEEEAWGGIQYYLEHTEELPQVSIVPDGQYPLIYCEKGLLDFDLSSRATNPAAEVRLISFTGGSGRNIVPAEAEAVLEGGNLDILCKKIRDCITKFGFDGDAVLKDQSVVISMKGKNAHAMSPEKGVNAISRLIHVMNAVSGEEFSHKKFAEQYDRYIGLTYNGEQCGLDYEDEDSGKLTFNVGTAKLSEDGSILLESNIRYPASMGYQMMIDSISNAVCKISMDVNYVDYLPPVSFHKDSPVIKTLMKVYQNMTGDLDTEPIAMGGATYARAIPNAVSFGPLFPDEEELAHEANEYIALDSLEKNFEIIFQALCALIEERC